MAIKIPAIRDPDFRVIGYFDGVSGKAEASIGSHTMIEGRFIVEADFSSNSGRGTVLGFGSAVNQEAYSTSIFVSSTLVQFRMVDNLGAVGGGTYLNIVVPIINGMATYVATWDGGAADIMTLDNGVDTPATLTGITGHLPSTGQTLVMGGIDSIDTSDIWASQGLYKQASYATSADGSNVVADYLFRGATATADVIDIISGNDAVLDVASLESFWIKNSARPSDALFDPLTNLGGYANNGFEGTIIQTDFEVIDQIVMSGGAEAVLDYNTIVDDKPEWGSVSIVYDLYWDVGAPDKWTVENGVETWTHPTANGTFPDKTGWDSGDQGSDPIVLAYDSYWVSAEEFIARSYADDLARTNLAQKLVDQWEKVNGVCLLKERVTYSQGLVETLGRYHEAVAWAEALTDECGILGVPFLLDDGTPFLNTDGSVLLVNPPA